MIINRNLCDICGCCVAVCPVDAISISEFSVTIHLKQCIKCGNCMQVCPAKAISEENI